MTCHAFNIEDAKQYGVDSAIILHNLRFWLDHNKANGSHINDGYVWTYNSARAFSELFPYWSSNKIQKLLKKLEGDGVVITGNYNKAGYDKTKWYTLTEYSLQPNGGMDSAKRINPSSQSAKPIPDINTHEISNEIKTDISKADGRVFLEDIKFDYDLRFCQEAIDQIKHINKLNYCRTAYDGSLTLREWQDCEDVMRSIDDFDFEYFTWWMETRSQSMNKKPSLPNMLCDMNETTFEQFYNSTFMQEADL